MKRIEPNPAKVETLFQGWSGRKAEIVKNVEAFFPAVDFPDVMYPRGGLARIYYASDKFLPGDDKTRRKTNNYVHCNVIEVEGEGETVCVCGHEIHDELPSSLATVYSADENIETEWHVKEPIEVKWPRLGSFCGEVDAWDEIRADTGDPDEDVYEVRFARPGWLVALDEKTAMIVRADGKVYLLTGAQMRITPRGIVG